MYGHTERLYGLTERFGQVSNWRLSLKRPPAAARKVGLLLTQP
jgi:hypothetical protein